MRIIEYNPSNGFDYLLGVIQGDGSVDHIGKNYSIRIAVKDKEYRDVLMKLLEDETGYSKYHTHKSGCFYVCNFRKMVFKEFKKYKNEGVWKIPKNLNINEWLAGLWDTDGRINYEGKEGVHRLITLGQKSTPNTRLIIKALNKLGIKNKKYKVKYKNIHGSFIDDIIRIPSSEFKKFYNLIPIKHPKKFRELQKIINHKRTWKNQFGGGICAKP